VEKGSAFIFLNADYGSIEDEGYFSPAWITVGISFFTLALAYGTTWYSFSVFFVPLLKEFNWSRSVGAGAFSVFMIIHGIVGPFAGSMVNRFGPRITFMVGSLTLGVGFSLSSLILSWLQFYIFFGVVTAMGLGLIGWVPNTTLIQQWFREKRGLPMGIISSGIGTGIFICVPFIQHLINRVGWRITYRLMAFFMPLIIISIVIAFLKKPPQTIASSGTKKEVIADVIKDHLIVNEQWASQSWTLRKSATKKEFWLLGCSFFLASLTTHSIFTHQVAFFTDQGLTALFASYIAGIIGIVSIGAKIFWGILSDKIGREITYSIGVACSVCGMIFLIAFSSFPFHIIPYIYAISFGFGYSVVTALPPLIVADFFQGSAYGNIFGALFMLNNVGGASGAWFAGFIFDQMKSYVPMFIIMIAFNICASVGIWIAAPRKIRLVPGKKGRAHRL
jgi:MFS family permease